MNVIESDACQSRNLLLRALSPDDLALLGPHLDPVSFVTGDTLVETGRPPDTIYFMESGVASIVCNTPAFGRTEVGIFGWEGMSGIAVVLGAETMPLETFIQVGDASALGMPTDRLRDAIDRSPGLHRLLLRYVQTFLVQSACSTLSNAHHRIESRLARWLLMCHDRVEGDELRLTHEFMSVMIAAQRTGVTVSLHILEGAGMIRSKRGRVEILDREKLIDLAGDAYGVPEAEYRRLIGPFGR